MLQLFVIGTYDVQEVTLSSQGGGRELGLSCSFLVGSLANGCRLTLCRMVGEVDPQTCTEETLPREAPTRVLSNLEVGMHVITEVADIESDGSINIIDDISFLGVLQIDIDDDPNIATTSFIATGE